MIMVDIRFDRRMELLSVLFYLSEYKDTVSFLVNLDPEHSLKEKAESWFAPWKEHRCVTLFNHLLNENNFNCDAPVLLFAQLTPDLKDYRLADYPYRDRLKAAPEVPQLMDALVEFAQISDFEGYYRSNEPFYQEVLAKAGRKDSPLMWGERHMCFDAGKVTDFMQRLYGPELMEGKEFSVIILSGGANGHFGITVDGRLTHVAPLEAGYPAVDNLTAAHEFSHPIVNPLVDKYMTADQRNSETLFAPIREQMKKAAYTSVDVIAKEYFVRTAEIVFAWVYDGEEARDREIRDNEERGFHGIGFLVERLYEYYQNPQEGYEAVFAPLLAELLKMNGE